MSFIASVRAMLATIMGEEYPGLAFAGPWTYRVTAVNVVIGGIRCDVAPADGNRMQALANVDQWPGVGGAVVRPKVGTECLVEFRDGRQDRPVIVAFRPLRTDLGTPDVATLDGDTVRVGPSATAVQLAVGPLDIGSPVARIGDTAGGGTLAVAMALGVPVFTYTPPGGVPGTPSASVALSSVITSGSGKVTSG